MAQLVLSEAGGYIGRQLAPQGVTFFGQQITGQAIGSYIGSLAGSAVDAYLFAPRYEGPRISQLHLTQSLEGAPVPNVYGRMRLGCNVIWTARFQENKEETGKGGPKSTTYSYSLSFAVALCEGEISRVSRAWVNGAEFDLSSVTWRLYRGSEIQQSDPLIEAIEGAGNAPAYKGLAYIVFEDLPLDEYGARIPQMSFEVVRTVGGVDRLESIVTGMNLIPGSGEFAYATEIIRREVRLGVMEAENQHTGSRDADFLVSLDQLLQDFPNLEHVNLIVGWFGSSIDCAQCEIRPGVERRDRRTKPRSWSVAGLDRESAYLISADENGRPSYGGTPDSTSVVQAILALKARGLKVTLYPFLFMDAPGFPWRGRITCDPAIENTSAAGDAVDAFFGAPTDWRYRRFILQCAELAAAAGGVDAFLIGSEMVELTRIRSAAGVYPAISQLKMLASEVRAIVGPATKLSYAADWTEYGAYAPQDGSNDIDFPLDDLWSDPNIDFVGLDWYAPMGDWRNGDQHLDAMAGRQAADDPDYLDSQIEAGEAYDYYYANQSDRDAQIRTPINDTAHNEHWIFRQKDVRGWWANSHFSRPGGVRASSPTSWTPGMKSIRFIEIGCPAVDKGANQPNVFYDPKSDESALPHYSSGASDDVIQRRAIESICRYWAGDPMLDHHGISVWAWDMRPYPVWPLNTEQWSDGGNWRFGHWLNGRAGVALLPDVVTDLADRAGVTVNVSGLNGLVSGYALDGVLSLRDALEPLRTSFGFRVAERETGCSFSNVEPAHLDLSLDDILLPEAGEPVESARSATEHVFSERLRFTFIDSEEDGRQGVVLSPGETDAPVRDVALPLLLDRDQAQFLVDDLASKAQELRHTAGFTLSPARLDIEPGDVMSFDNNAYQVLRLTDGVGRHVEALKYNGVRQSTRSIAAPSEPSQSNSSAPPVIAIIDAPPIPGEEDDVRPIVFAAASPWPGPVTVEAGADPAALTLSCTIEKPCIIGELVADAPIGEPWRWNAGMMEVQVVSGSLSSVDQTRVLNGANAAMLETPAGWELFQFQNAELIGDDLWRLSGLLRGQQGSEPLLTLSAGAGVRVVVFSGGEQRLDLTGFQSGLPLNWRAQAARADDNAVASGVFTSDQVALRQWAPAHLKAKQSPQGLELSWVRRGRRGGDGWGASEPLLDGIEQYQVDCISAGETLFSKRVDAAQLVIDSSELNALGNSFDVHVTQLGADQRPGYATVLSVTISH